MLGQMLNSLVCLHGDGYKRIRLYGESWTVSRLISKMVPGNDPGSYEVEHKDRNKLTNEWIT